MIELSVDEQMASALREIKFILNACQLIINDPTARETIRDLVQQADRALARWTMETGKAIPK